MTEQFKDEGVKFETYEVRNRNPEQEENLTALLPSQSPRQASLVTTLQLPGFGRHPHLVSMTRGSQVRCGALVRPS
jgi:hypothetical protein